MRAGRQARAGMASAFAAVTAAILAVATKTVLAATENAQAVLMPPSPPPPGWTGTWLLSTTDGASAEAACELAKVREGEMLDFELVSTSASLPLPDTTALSRAVLPL